MTGILRRKNASKQAIACSADQKTFCIYWLQTKLQKRHNKSNSRKKKARGGGGGEAYNRRTFLFTGRWACNWGV